MGKTMLKNTEGIIRSVNGRKKDNTMIKIKKRRSNNITQKTKRSGNRNPTENHGDQFR
jgi:hypothetical protein